MSRKHRRCYCLLPEEATSESAHALQCGVGGHSHLTFAELYGPVDYLEANREIQRRGTKYVGFGGMLERGEVKWLCFPRVLRLHRDPKKRKQQKVQLRGLSALVGATLAEASQKRSPEGWACVLLDEVLQHRRPPVDEEFVLEGSQNSKESSPVRGSRGAPLRIEMVGR